MGRGLFTRQRKQEQLHGMAAAAGGHYLPATDSLALLREFKTAVFETPESFVLSDGTGKQIATGPFGQNLELPAGNTSPCELRRKDV
jgi:hypothetical protein